ncbi:MAG: hypothetical protein APF77_04005 [Clostridia bacterium BRH_c25]|nr:MAG: hypothetical protein APF77_04005 [Clostridia bacterium BRH_c25]
MHGNTINYYLVKLGKPLLIALPLNLLAALIYCLIAKKMSLASYSNALLIIGGVYAAIGGMSFMGGMDAGARSTMTWRGDINQKKHDDSGRDNFRISGFIIGMITILISYVLVIFR